MFMKSSFQVVCGAIIAFLFILAFCVSFFWHSSPLILIAQHGSSLSSFDNVVFSDSNFSCFSISSYPLDSDIGKRVKVLAVSNNILLVDSFIDFNSFPVSSKEFCFSSSLLVDGNNFVDVFVAEKNLFYHLEKSSSLSPMRFTNLSILDLNSAGVLISVSDFPVEKYQSFSIFVNGNFVKNIYPIFSDDVFFEELSFSDGNNFVEVLFNSDSGVISDSSSFFVEPVPSSNLLFGILFFVFAFFVFSCFVFPKFDSFFGLFAISLAASFILFIFVGFILNILSLLSLFSFFSLLFIVLFLLIYFFRNNFYLIPFEFNKLFNGKILFYLVIALFVFMGVFFHIFSYHHLTDWNGFYERHSYDLAEDFSLKEFDSLSYLGRPLSYVPGYFFLNASFSWIFGIFDQQLFAVLLSVSLMFFLSSCFYFARSLNFSLERASLLIILLSTIIFLLTALTLSPRHVFSLGLYILALALAFNKKPVWLVSLVLAFSAFIQIPLLIFWPLAYLVFSRKIDLSYLIKVFFLAGIFFAVLFLPTLLYHGFPFVAEVDDWGYLINVSPSYILADFSSLFVFFIFFVFLDLLNKKIVFDEYAIKLALGVLLGFCIELFLTYRWNIMTGITLALFLVYIIPKKAFSGKYVSRAIAMIIIIAFAALFISNSFLTIHDIRFAPITFISENSSSEANVLSDPLFGHGLSFIGGKKVLADLYVEYAPEEKLKDAYYFLTDANYSILSKYDISFTVNQIDYINREATSGIALKNPLEFRELNKIYSNNFLFIHQVPAEYRKN